MLSQFTIKKKQSLKTGSENDFFIDKEVPAKIINESDKITYNFLIHRNNDSSTDSFENLAIVCKKDDNTVKAYIVKYTSNDVLKVDNLHHEVNFKGKTKITPLLDDDYDKLLNSKIVEICTYNTIYYCDYQYTHIAGPNCQHTYPITTADCISFDDGTSSGGDGTGGSTAGGSSSGSGTSVTTSPVINKNNPLNLSEDDLAWYNSQTSAVKSIITFVTQNTNTIAEDVIGFMAINPDIKQLFENYLLANNNIEGLKFIAQINVAAIMNDYNLEQLKNWFFTPSEGQDYEYNAAFWEDPNLTFPQQNLPTRAAFRDAMPKDDKGKLLEGADNIYGLVGGDVLKIRKQYPAATRNTCALKTSIALVKCGIVIPKTPDTFEGTGEFAGKYFFLNARALNAWMQETFGTNHSKHIRLTAADGGVNGINFPKIQQLQNISGIYSMITLINPITKLPYDGFWGHADYVFTRADNGLVHCPFGCYWNAKIEQIDIWILD